MTTPSPVITTDLFLLLFRDDGKPEAMGQMSNYGLAGGLLADLTIAGRVQASDDAKRVHVVDPTPTGDPLLDEGLRRIAAKDGKRVQSVVQSTSKQLEHVVGTYLAERGVVSVEESAFLGLKPQRYPTTNPSLEQRLRAGLVQVLRGANPTAEQHAVLGLLHSLDLGRRVFDEGETGLRTRELQVRLKELATTAGPSADAVARAVAAMTTAITTAALVSTYTSS